MGEPTGVSERIHRPLNIQIGMRYQVNFPHTTGTKTPLHPVFVNLITILQ